MKKTFSNKEKAAIALRALTQMESASAIASAASVHPVQVGMWKKMVQDNAHMLFEKTKNESETIRSMEAKIDELHRIIGKREEELSWLEKKSTLCRP
jgi:putative transposase